MPGPTHLWNLLIILISVRHSSRSARRHGRGVHCRVAVQRNLGAQLRVLLQLLRRKQMSKFMTHNSNYGSASLCSRSGPKCG